MVESPSSLRPRVALLVDGDNLSHAHAGALILAAARHGTLTVKRVYGNVATHPGWDEAPGFRNFHSGRGKNAADLALTVDAMALMLTGQADVLAIASSDGDFSHLALHLVEKGAKVVGIGESKAPEHFRKSCSSFHDLCTPSTAKPPQDAQAKAPSRLVEQTCALIAAASGRMPINQLNAHMDKAHKVRIGQTEFKTWRAFLIAHPDRFRCDKRGPDACVHLVS